jgi:hypothetical protein
MPIASELRGVIGALQGEVEFEAAGGDRSSCVGAVGCDIEQLPSRLKFVRRMRAEAVHLERPLQRHDGALDQLQESYRG